MPSAAIDYGLTGQLPVIILTALSCLIVLFCIPEIVKCFIPVMKCAFGIKHSFTLAESMNMCHCRDLYAVSSVIPFILVAGRYDLYPPATGLPTYQSLLLISGIFTAYFTLKSIISWLFSRRWDWSRERDWKNCEMLTFTFFAITMTVLAVTVAVFLIVGTDDVTANIVLTWEIIGVYLLFLVRRIQIFLFYGSFLETLLYLCALEFIPCGLLLASALVF